MMLVFSCLIRELCKIFSTLYLVSSLMDVVRARAHHLEILREILFIRFAESSSSLSGKGVSHSLHNRRNNEMESVYLPSELFRTVIRHLVDIISRDYLFKRSTLVVLIVSPFSCQSIHIVFILDKASALITPAIHF
jgi:hypothetical protein